MATSGSFDYARTTNNIISRSLRIVGVPEPDTNQHNQAKEALNCLFKEWENDGIRLWQIVETTLTTSDGVAHYVISNDTLEVIPNSVYLRDSTSNADEELELLKIEQYEAQLDTGQGTESRPTAIVFRPHATYVGGTLTTGIAEPASGSGPVITVYPIPDTTYTIRYRRVRRLEDFDAAANNPDTTQRWLDALVYGLASRLADEFTLPLPERSFLMQKAELLMSRARGGERDKYDNSALSPCY